MSNKYFSIPFDLVPPAQALSQPCTIWYATWSTTPPVCGPGAPPPAVIGVTEHEIPDGATLLGSVTKEPPLPPTFIDSASYAAMVGAWLAAEEERKNADE